MTATTANSAMDAHCRVDGHACKVCCAACNSGGCERHCGAVKRNGNGKGHLCRNPAGKGTTHRGVGACDDHLGDTKSHQKAAEREIAARNLQKAVAMFGLNSDVDAGEALQDLVNRTYALVVATAAELAALGDNVDGLYADGKPSPTLELHQWASTQLTKVAKACLDAGVAERQVQLAEGQGRQLAEVISGTIAGVFAELLAAGLEADLLARIRRERIPGVIRANLAALATPTEEVVE